MGELVHTPLIARSEDYSKHFVHFIRRRAPRKTPVKTIPTNPRTVAAVDPTRIFITSRSIETLKHPNEFISIITPTNPQYTHMNINTFFEIGSISPFRIWSAVFSRRSLSRSCFNCSFSDARTRNLLANSTSWPLPNVPSSMTPGALSKSDNVMRGLGFGGTASQCQFYIMFLYIII